MEGLSRQSNESRVGDRDERERDPVEFRVVVWFIDLVLVDLKCRFVSIFAWYDRQSVSTTTTFLSGRTSQRTMGVPVVSSHPRR